MSAMARPTERAARCFAAKRLRADGRLRHADAGTVTEMARSLLREARETADGEARHGHDAIRLDRIESMQAAEPITRAA
jgi:hypothetical protein